MQLDVVLRWIEEENNQGAPSLSYNFAPRFSSVCAPNLRSEFGKKEPIRSAKKKRFYWTLLFIISVLQSILYALADPRVLAAFALRNNNARVAHRANHRRGVCIARPYIGRVLGRALPSITDLAESSSHSQAITAFQMTLLEPTRLEHALNHQIRPLDAPWIADKEAQDRIHMNAARAFDESAVDLVLFASLGKVVGAGVQNI